MRIIILALLIALIACSCAEQSSKNGPQTPEGAMPPPELNTGLIIEYGPNAGMIDTFSAGNYIHITATITNDSIIPIHLQVAISKEVAFPDSCGDHTYKLFLLPQELTPDTPTLYGKITEETGDFLDSCLENPYILNKTLEPGEYTVITIGTLFSSAPKCAALPRAVFTQSDVRKFQACDNRMLQKNSTLLQLALGVKLDFYSGKGPKPETCILIPCGQISYPEN